MNWVQKENIHILTFMDQYLFLVQEMEDGWRWIAGKPPQGPFADPGNRYETAQDAKNAVNYFLVNIVSQSVLTASKPDQNPVPQKPVLLGPISAGEVREAATWYDKSDTVSFVLWDKDAPQDLKRWQAELAVVGHDDEQRFEVRMADGVGTEVKTRVSLADALRDTYSWIAEGTSARRELVERPLRKEQLSSLTQSINNYGMVNKGATGG